VVVEPPVPSTVLVVPPEPPVPSEVLAAPPVLLDVLPSVLPLLVVPSVLVASLVESSGNGPVMAKVNPESIMLTNRILPSGEKQTPANSPPGSIALAAKSSTVPSVVESLNST
jgi:hypothetical protein